MSNRRKRQPILAFSDQLGKIVADNTLETPVEADSPIDAPSPPDPAPEAASAPTQALVVPAPAAKRPPAKPKRVKPRRPPASTETPKTTVSVRVPIFHAKLLDAVRKDARTYRTSENRLIAVHVRRAVERLREMIAENDLDSLKPSDDVERALTTYSTSLMMTSDELDTITARLDPRGYFGNSRNLATAIALLIEDA